MKYCNNLAGQFYAQVLNYKSGTVKRTYGTPPNSQALQARFTRRSERIIKDPIRNLITNAGLNYLGYDDWSSLSIWLGTGVNDFAYTDTELGSLTLPSANLGNAGSLNTREAIDANTHRFRTTLTQTYLAGRVSGTFTELGVNSANTNADLTTNNPPFLALSLIKDSEGNPSAITLQPDEELKISHSIDNIVSNSLNVPVAFEWGGEPVAATLRVHNHMSSQWYLSNNVVPRTMGVMNASGGNQATISGSRATYQDQSYQRGAYWSMPLANADTTFHAIAFYSGGYYRLDFDDGLPRVKSKDEIFTFGTSENPAIMVSWGRA